MKSTKTSELQEKILKLCNKDYLTVAELAEALGRSVNTIRAHYVYPLVRQGKLMPLYPHRRMKQAYIVAVA